MKVIKEIMRNAGKESKVMSDVRETCVGFSLFLGQLGYGSDTLHELVDEIYEEVPEIEGDVFWTRVNEEFGASLVAGLVVDELADLLQEQFNSHFNGTDLKFENTGDIIDFLITEPGKICANLPKDVTVGDICELFERLVRQDFGKGNLGQSEINIYDLVLEGIKDVAIEGEIDLDMLLEGEKLEGFIYEYLLPVIENSGATAFVMYQTDDNLQRENKPEDDSEV